MVLVLVGLPAASGLGDPGQTGGELRFARPFDVDHLDPALAYIPDMFQIGFATCARLYSYPDKPAPEGVEVIPEVAKDFPRVSQGGRTYTIELRRTYRFDTGARITAANYVAALNRDANPKLQSPATAYLHEIVGADAVMEGKAQTIAGIRVLGPYTLRIRTTRPLPDLPARLTVPFFCPIAVNTPLEEITNPLGSGPYYVALYVPNRQIVLERNPFYRGPRRANVDRVVWTIGIGREACRVAVERDELDYCGGPGLLSTAFGELEARYGINRKDGQFFFNRDLSTWYFAFNHDRPAFKGSGQIPLKQAINWAIDRPALVRAGGPLRGKRTDQILPPPLTRPERIYPLGGVTERSLARARALLAKASFRPERLVLYAFSSPVDRVQAQIFQFNLKRLGIEVDVTYLSLEAMFEKAGTRGEPFDVVQIGWLADYADPAAFFLPLLSGASIKETGNSNYAYFDRPRYNREIARISRLTGETRRKAWADLDVEMMRNDPPWAPIRNGARVDLVSKSFGCYVFQPVIGRVDIVSACKK
jgi:ABC-type transport system substrate-binding protein